MKKIKVNFKNRRGLILRGYLDLPDRGLTTSYGIFSHCFTCNKQYKVILKVNEELTKRGFAVLRFDLTGLGESEGKFSDTNFSTYVEDTIDGANFLKENFDSPSFLIGHSLGGVSSIKASKYIDSVKAISTIGSPYGLKNLDKLFAKYKDELYLKGEAIVDVGGRKFKIKKEFLIDSKKHDLTKDIKELSKPILIFHAPNDDIVDISQGEEFFNNCHQPKSFVSLNNADHLVTNNEDSKYIGTVLGNWLVNSIK